MTRPRGWIIGMGSERESGNSVLSEWPDNDNDDDIYSQKDAESICCNLLRKQPKKKDEMNDENKSCKDNGSSQNYH